MPIRHFSEFESTYKIKENIFDFKKSGDFNQLIEEIKYYIKNGYFKSKTTFIFDALHITKDQLTSLFQSLINDTPHQSFKIYINGGQNHFSNINDEKIAIFCGLITTHRLPERLKLYITDSQITDKGALILAKAIQNIKCPKWLCIDLRGSTSITETGKKAIKNALTICHPSIQVKLCDDSFNQFRIKKTMLSCIIFEKGVRCGKSHPKIFTRGIRETIYKYAFPKKAFLFNNNNEDKNKSLINKFSKQIFSITDQFDFKLFSIEPNKSTNKENSNPNQMQSSNSIERSDKGLELIRK